ELGLTGGRQEQQSGARQNKERAEATRLNPGIEAKGQKGLLHDAFWLTNSRRSVGKARGDRELELEHASRVGGGPRGIGPRLDFPAVAHRWGIRRPQGPFLSAGDRDPA